MGMAWAGPPTDVLGNCDVCGEPLASFLGHTHCTIERLTAERDHARGWMREAAEKLMSDDPDPRAVARLLLREAEHHEGRALTDLEGTDGR